MSFTYFFLFFSFLLIQSPKANASMIKKVVIDGESYSCRPSNIEPACHIKTDLGFVMAVAASASDSALCVQNLNDNKIATPETVKDCFLQRRLKNVARELETQIAGPKCWSYFIEKCSENTLCPEFNKPEKRCGYLGEFINALKANGLEELLSEKEAIALCRSLSE